MFVFFRFATPALALNKSEATQSFYFVLVPYESMLGGHHLDTRFEFLGARLLGET